LLCGTLLTRLTFAAGPPALASTGFSFSLSRHSGPPKSESAIFAEFDALAACRRSPQASCFEDSRADPSRVVAFSLGTGVIHKSAVRRNYG
jgi:hypothetical protein